MTEKMLAMSKEELINYIAECDRLGKKVGELNDAYEHRVNDMLDKMKYNVEMMKMLAVLKAEMKQILRDKYGVSVM